VPIVEEIHGFRRIAPLALERAVRGHEVADAPEVDDRGWDPDPASVSYTRADVHGPVVGLSVGTNLDSRVKLKRVRLEPTAELFLVSKDTGTVTIEAPAGGGPLPADGIFTLHGVSAGSGNKFAVVEVRLGSTSGPLLMEFGVRVFQVIRVPVLPHLVTINGTACTTTAANVTTLETQVNAIWRACGVRFNFRATVSPPPIAGFTTAGVVSSNYSNAAVGAMPANDFTELTRVTALARAGDAINLYFVRSLIDVSRAAPNNFSHAVTWDKVGFPTGHGVVMRDGATGRDLAHEFGHFLSLDHADESSPGAHTRDDMWVYRQLMYSYRPLPTTVGYRTELGYGRNEPGSLITLRNRPQFNKDAEWFDARTRARNPF
jgi:hypothetical protein